MPSERVVVLQLKLDIVGTKVRQVMVQGFKKPSITKLIFLLAICCTRTFVKSARSGAARIQRERYLQSRGVELDIHTIIF
jgi:hypothetical protein